MDQGLRVHGHLDELKHGPGPFLTGYTNFILVVTYSPSRTCNNVPQGTDLTYPIHIVTVGGTKCNILNYT